MSSMHHHLKSRQNYKLALLGNQRVIYCQVVHFEDAKNYHSVGPIGIVVVNTLPPTITRPHR